MIQTLSENQLFTLAIPAANQGFISYKFVLVCLFVLSLFIYLFLDLIYHFSALSEVTLKLRCIFVHKPTHFLNWKWAEEAVLIGKASFVWHYQMRVVKSQTVVQVPSLPSTERGLVLYVRKGLYWLFDMGVQRSSGDSCTPSSWRRAQPKLLTGLMEEEISPAALPQVYKLHREAITALHTSSLNLFWFSSDQLI